MGGRLIGVQLYILSLHYIEHCKALFFVVWEFAKWSSIHLKKKKASISCVDFSKKSMIVLQLLKEVVSGPATCN